MKQIQPPSIILELPNIHYRIIDLIYDLYLYIYLNLSIFLIYSKINLNEKKNTQLTLFTQQCMFCYHLIFNTTALQLFIYLCTPKVVCERNWFCICYSQEEIDGAFPSTQPILSWHLIYDCRMQFFL